MISFRIILASGALGLIAACAGEQPPPPVDEFMANSILLEATMVRCGQNRSQTKYDADCVNAREAANRLATIEEQARRAELEAESERKRQALRRTQEAAAEARRRAAEAQRLREQEAYLGHFDGTAEGGIAPSGADGGEGSTAMPLEGNRPGVQVAPGSAETADNTAEPGNETPADLEAVREELRRRQDDSG